MPGTNTRRFKVFSTKKVSMQVEAANQTRKYWLVESDSKSLLTIRPLDEQTWLPTGRPRPITVHELQQRYALEAKLYEECVQPVLEKHAGDTSLFLSAGTEKEAPPVNETEVISNFQKGLDLLKGGNVEKAATLFSGLLNSGEAFEEKHKHLFNDFAIQLRKSNQPGQAVAFYTKALELSWGDEDENLHINLARALFTEKQYSGCVQHLFDALRIVPGHKVAHDFLAWLEQQNLVPKQYALQVKGCLAQPQEAPHEEQERAERATGGVALHHPEEGTALRSEAGTARSSEAGTARSSEAGAARSSEAGAARSPEAGAPAGGEQQDANPEDAETVGQFEI